MNDIAGSPTPSATVLSLYRYPVKGLTPEYLSSANLRQGQSLDYDRAYAIENGAGRFDPIAPRHLPKINFLMLMRDERLATLRTHFDDDTHTLTIFRDDRQVAKGQLNTPLGRRLVEQFLSSYFASELRGSPHIVHAAGHTFSDVSAKCLHIINLASVRELERLSGRTINPLRFRANVHIDGLAPWQEFEWVGRKIRAGTAELEAFSRTQRCDATNVDPETAERDMAIPSLLQRHLGHTDFGIYATVTAGGALSVNDSLQLLT